MSYITTLSSPPSTLAATPTSLASVWNVMRALIKGGDLSLVIMVRSSAATQRIFLGSSLEGQRCRRVQRADVPHVANDCNSSTVTLFTQIEISKFIAPIFQNLLFSRKTKISYVPKSSIRQRIGSSRKLR